MPPRNAKLRDAPPHVWQFKRRFRRNAFGWRSQPAIVRIREAVREIRGVARRDRSLAAEGAVAFLERVSRALEAVDSSSGAIGTCVNSAVEQLAGIVASAEVDPVVRSGWLERLWNAYLDDQMPYIESLADHWGALCVSRELAGEWTDRLIDDLRASMRAPSRSGGYYRGTTVVLSSLLQAQRYDELLGLLQLRPATLWFERKFGFAALVAQGRRAEALRYAEASHDPHSRDASIDRACEDLLLASGLAEDAYRRYGLAAGRGYGTYLARFRDLAKRYPHKAAADLLADLVEASPGDEGSWFATAKAAGLYDEAISLARRSPSDPRTLARAARQFADENPRFAFEASLTALHWISLGHGYEITIADIREAFDGGLHAARLLDAISEFRDRVRAMALPARAGIGKLLETELARIERNGFIGPAS